MKKFSIVVLTLSILLVFPLSSIQAQEEVSLGFAPTSDYLTLSPGETYENFFTVWNLKDSTTTYYINATGFAQVEDMPGTARFLTPEEDARDPYSASSWVELDIDELDLVPQKNIDIPYTITVPDNVALGEYYVKIYLATDKERDLIGNGTIANLGSGPNILIKIGTDEELNDDASILDFRTDKHIYNSTPVMTFTEIENSGNTHVTPKGDLIITNMFNQEVGRLPFNDGDISLLRGETATYENSWTVSREIITEEGKIAFGKMQIELLSPYKNINPGFSPLIASTSFWIIPWKLILAILGAIVLLIVVLVVVKKKRSGKKNASKPKQS